MPDEASGRIPLLRGREGQGRGQGQGSGWHEDGQEQRRDGTTSFVS